MTTEKYDTRYGTIFHSPVCKDDWSNISTSRLYRKPSGVVVHRPRKLAITLQRPALASLKMAEVKLGSEIVTTGSIRTCEKQAELYLSDTSRFAHPNSTLHTQGLAIDVHTDYLTKKLHDALFLCGWKQSRPDDEPWHYSFHLAA